MVDQGEPAAHFDWDSFYVDERAPWNLGRPQPAFDYLTGLDEVESPVLDSGCGTGEHALMLAAVGHDVTGVDISPRAIERANEKAARRGLDATFVVGDVLDLERLGRHFRTVIDCGVFHVFDDDDRAASPASPRWSTPAAPCTCSASRSTRRVKAGRAG